MNELQELINWVKAQEEKAEKLEKTERPVGLYFCGRASAFSDVVLVAELLLKQQKNSDNQPAFQQANVMPSLLDFKERRQKAGLTLREVEKITGISNAYLSQLENKKIGKPSFTVVQKLNDIYASNGA